MGSKNKAKEKISPWIPGIIDTIVGSIILRKSQIAHRNRLAVILLDSALETSCRAFLKYKEKINLTDSHKSRNNLMKTIKSKIKDIDEEVWEILDFNYKEIRCDFYHQSASKTITDDAFTDYYETVEFVIDRLLGIKSGQIANSKAQSLSMDKVFEKSSTKEPSLSRLYEVKNNIDKLLIAVSKINPNNVLEVNDFFKKVGESYRLTQKEFTNILARNRGTKKFFYYNKDFKVWQLSGLGDFKLGQIRKEDYNE